MTRRSALVLVALLGMSLGACGDGEGDIDGGRAPYPGIGGGGRVEGERNLARLVSDASQGVARKMPWAGYWFPYSDDGIASAANLYERVGGRAGATQWEVSNHGSSVPGLESWWGHCNGWAAAAVLFSEPRSSRDVDGVSFDVSRQKALLTEVGMEVQADFFGQRYDGGNTGATNFQDVFPNQFFLIMTNYLGRGAPVIMDRYTGSQVWNHPIAGYRLGPIGPDSVIGTHPDAPNITRVAHEMTVWWVRDDVDGGHLTEPFAFADGPSYESRTLRYELWVDGPLEFSGDRLVRSGDVILVSEGNTVSGGVWRNGDLDPANSHPDYIWIPHRVAPSSGFTNPFVDLGYVRENFGS